MQSGGMSTPYGAESGGLRREGGGRPRPHIGWEKAPVARDQVRPTGINQPPHEPNGRVNVKGALPLLLIGGAAVAYSIVLALQSAAVAGHRLSIWVLVLVAGAIILAAGVVSLFWAELEEDQGKPERQPSVVEAIDSGVSTRRKESIPPERPSPPPPPPWWEGPPANLATTSGRPTGAPRAEAGPAPVSATSVVSPPRSTSPAANGSAAGVARSASAPRPPTRAPSTAGPEPSALRRGFPRKFMDDLAELESLADRELKLSPPRLQRAGTGGLRSCADCKRGMSNDRSPSHCSSCRRELCVDCALSSQLEDGELRCIECRVRAS
jgi:hypothetical protein